MRFWSLQGYPTYEEVRKLQLELVDQRSREEIPDTVLFLEHAPVITQGRGLQWIGKPRPRHMPLPLTIPQGIEFAESERGGDLTYHGPGQWVVYPICKLDGKGFGPDRDIAGFLRKLEGVLIEELQSRGLPAIVKEQATGVWISGGGQGDNLLRGDKPGADRKIASIGVAVRKWVTYHGLALNCVNDLAPFHLISPCGFSPEVMTRLADWVELGSSWREDLEQSFARRLFPEAANEIHSVRI